MLASIFQAPALFEGKYAPVAGRVHPPGRPARPCEVEAWEWRRPS